MTTPCAPSTWRPIAVPMPASSRCSWPLACGPVAWRPIASQTIASGLPTSSEPTASRRIASSPKPSARPSTSAAWRDGRQPRCCHGGRRPVPRRVCVRCGRLIGRARQLSPPSGRASCAPRRHVGSFRSSSCPSDVRPSVVGTTGRRRRPAMIGIRHDLGYPSSAALKRTRPPTSPSRSTSGPAHERRSARCHQPGSRCGRCSGSCCRSRAGGAGRR